VQSVSKSFLAALFVSVAVLSTPASAETIQGALSKAYQNNSKLNSARAGVRVTDEGVAIAKSGYRPTIAGSASIDYSTTRREGGGTTRPRRAISGTRSTRPFRRHPDEEQCGGPAEGGACRHRSKGLRNTEEDTSIRRPVLQERDSRPAGGQADGAEPQGANRAGARGRARASRWRGSPQPTTPRPTRHASERRRQLSARARSAGREAAYRQNVGEQPGTLKAGRPLAKLLRQNLESAFAIASNEHPAILANPSITSKPPASR